MSKGGIDLSELMRIVVAVMFCFSIMLAIYPDLRIRCHKLWIQSPTKNTTKLLPFYQALRVVRKHKWHLVETYPLMTRWQAFKYAMGGRQWIKWMNKD